MQLDLAFDAEAHAYTLGGVRIPSVTQVLSFGQDLSRIPRWTAERGTAFHLCTELDDIGDLDPESVDPLVQPHLKAYRGWRRIRRPHFIHTELKVWGEIDGLKYAGTIDRVYFTSLALPELLYLADLKSGAPRKEHGAQLAAYRGAFEQRTPRKIEGLLGVYCDKEGRFSERPYDGPEYLEAFRVKLHRYYEGNCV